MVADPTSDHQPTSPSEDEDARIHAEWERNRAATRCPRCTTRKRMPGADTCEPCMTITERSQWLRRTTGGDAR